MLIKDDVSTKSPCLIQQNGMVIVRMDDTVKHVNIDS